MLTWVPLDTPLHEVLIRERSRPPTRSFGMFTSIELDLHSTGTAREGPRMNLPVSWGRAIPVRIGGGKRENHRQHLWIWTYHSNLTTHLAFPPTQHKPELPLPQILQPQQCIRKQWRKSLHWQQKLSCAFQLHFNTQHRFGWYLLHCRALGRAFARYGYQIHNTPGKAIF